MSSSSTKWGKKLATKLTALNESSSKESIQTLAQWIGFNRKHTAEGFVPVFHATLAKSSGALQLTYLTVLHEVLIMENENSSKWEKMEEMRVALGEGVLLKIVAQLQDASRDKLRTTFLKEWDDTHSFGGPTLINAIKKAVALHKASSEATSETPGTMTESASPKQSDAASTSEVAVKPSPQEESTALAKQGLAQESKEAGISKSKQIDKPTPDASQTNESSKSSKGSAKPRPATAPTSATSTATYDFEASGFQAAKVDPKTLLEPTRTIASLQIARDLRNDGAVQLSSLLSNLPENIQQSWVSQEELTADKARDYAMRTPDVLINMDLEEQLQSIRMYRDIVKRQGAARQKLIRALIQSRCKFGADEAADAFETALRARGQLLKRKQVLMDAMELEGLDVTEEQKNMHSQDAVEFAPLEWHKKARTEES